MIVTVAAELISVGAPAIWVKSIAASFAQLTTGVTAAAGRTALTTVAVPALAARAGAAGDPASWNASSKSPARATTIAKKRGRVGGLRIAALP